MFLFNRPVGHRGSMITSSRNSSSFFLQATIPGFLARGMSLDEAEDLLRTSVKLALEARDEFWKSTLRKSKPIYNHALVAASIGSYGAYLADGSEYR